MSCRSGRWKKIRYCFIVVKALAWEVIISLSTSQKSFLFILLLAVGPNQFEVAFKTYLYHLYLAPSYQSNRQKSWLCGPISFLTETCDFITARVKHTKRLESTERCWEIWPNHWKRRASATWFEVDCNRQPGNSSPKPTLNLGARFNRGFAKVPNKQSNSWIHTIISRRSRELLSKH